jgi:hypothetical protein
MRLRCDVGFEDMPLLHKAINLSRFLFLIAIAFLIAGGSLEGFSDTDSTGRRLLQVAYIVLAIFLAVIMAFQAYLWRHMIKFTPAGAAVRAISYRRMRCL